MESTDNMKCPIPIVHTSTCPSNGSDSKIESNQFHLHPPSPLITRRNRRASLSERAAQGPIEHGTVKYFCRQRGHGFVTPDSGGDDIFLHISDIEGEYVPCDGDKVAYKVCQIPPKFLKMQAIHAVIEGLAPGVKHERWEDPPTPHKHPHPSPTTGSCSDSGCCPSVRSQSSNSCPSVDEES